MKYSVERLPAGTMPSPAAQFNLRGAAALLVCRYGGCEPSEAFRVLGIDPRENRELYAQVCRDFAEKD